MAWLQKLLEYQPCFSQFSRYANSRHSEGTIRIKLWAGQP